MATPPGAGEITLNILPTFGAALMGCFGMMGLYGITCVQTYIYFVFYPDDSRQTKSLVWLLWLLDSVHIVLVCHAVFHYLVSNFSHPAALAEGIWSLWLSILVNCVTACIVQGFFAMRLYVLMGSPARNWVVPAIMLLVLGHMAFGVESAIFGLIEKTFVGFQSKLYISALPFAVFAVLSDVVIAGALCIKLHRTKSYLMTGNSVINHLIIFAVNRCLLTAGVAVLEITLFAAFPNALWYLALDFGIGKLYANSLLATLNTRYSIRIRGGGRIFSPGKGGKSVVTTSGTVPSFQIPNDTDRVNPVFSTVLPVVSHVDQETLGHLDQDQDLVSTSDTRSVDNGSHPKSMETDEQLEFKRFDFDDQWQAHF